MKKSEPEIGRLLDWIASHLNHFSLPPRNKSSFFRPIKSLGEMTFILWGLAQLRPDLRASYLPWAQHIFEHLDGKIGRRYWSDLREAIFHQPSLSEILQVYVQVEQLTQRPFSFTAEIHWNWDALLAGLRPLSSGPEYALGLVGERPFGGGESLHLQAHPAAPWSSSRTYEMTHWVFYRTDMGRRVWANEESARALSAQLAGAMSHRLELEDLDLVAECFISRRLLGALREELDQLALRQLKENVRIGSGERVLIQGNRYSEKGTFEEQYHLVLVTLLALAFPGVKDCPTTR